MRAARDDLSYSYKLNLHTSTHENHTFHPPPGYDIMFEELPTTRMLLNTYANMFATVLDANPASPAVSSGILLTDLLIDTSSYQQQIPLQSIVILC